MWSPLGLFWSAKYLNFEQKLPIRTAHHIFLERRQHEFTKIHVMVCPHGEPKKVSDYGLLPVCGGVYIHYFKINSPTFCYPLFSENYLNPWVRINKIVNKCQLPIIIFLWTRKGFISPESFLNFLLNLDIPPWLPKSFKFIVLRLLQIQM